MIPKLSIADNTVLLFSSGGRHRILERSVKLSLIYRPAWWLIPVGGGHLGWVPAVEYLNNGRTFARDSRSNFVDNNIP